MTHCRDCEQRRPVASCAVKGIEIGGITYMRVRLGKETKRRPRGPRCPECHVERGGRHHIGCDREQCPTCGGELVRCGCFGGVRNYEAEISALVAQHPRR